MNTGEPMRSIRWLFLVTAVAVLSGMVAHASAELPRWLPPAPSITALYWADPPVETVDPACEPDCPVEELVVEARDLDSSISEVIVSLGEGQPILWASTGCVQGKLPGMPAVLRIPATYFEAGTYTVTVQAFSAFLCHPLAPHQSSRVVALRTEVVAGS